MFHETIIGGFIFSTDKAKLDVDYIHCFLSSSYWAKEIPIGIVKHSIENSVCAGIYDEKKQVGFARIVTDYATFAYLADVFVDEEYRGRGLSKQMMEFILSFDFLRGVRRIMLATRDAHGLYAQFGFAGLQRPDRYMEIQRQDMYVNQ